MAIRTYVIKNNHQEALVKIVNDADASAQATIDLDVTLLKYNESLSGKPLDVAIRSVEWSLQPAGVATITRNAKVIQRLHSTYSFVQAVGADHEESASDIVVDMTGGTMLIHLLKTSGFVGTQTTEPRLP